jgi:chromate reductase, NAD(P)H dehydrogenase (quinone)
VQIVTVSGSLGPASANQAALHLALDHLRTTQPTVVVSPADVSAIPSFRPDQVDVPPEPVATLRAAVGAADGLLLAAPEYAGGVSGVTKNVLDWMVGSASLYRKPIAVLSAGTTGGKYAIEQLVRTLSWHGALVVATLSIEAPATKMSAGRYTDSATIAAVAEWTDELIRAVSSTWETTLAQVTAVVVEYGIDPRRFGEG